MNEITIYRDIAVPVVAKIVHIRKIGGRLRCAFVRTWGDLPIGTLNRITGKIMDVENPRGRAYAARNRAAYRRTNRTLKQQPQLRRPVLKRQAKSFEVRVARADLCLDCRKLLVAPFDSGRILQPPRRYIIESSAAVEKRFLTRVLLPAPDDHIAVPRLQLDQPRLPPRLLARDQRRAGPAEDIENRVARLAAVADRPLDQFDRLHRRVFEVRHGPLDEPHVALVPRAAPEVIRARRASRRGSARTCRW